LRQTRLSCSKLSMSCLMLGVRTQTVAERIGAPWRPDRPKLEKRRTMTRHPSYTRLRQHGPLLRCTEHPAADWGAGRTCSSRALVGSYTNLIGQTAKNQSIGRARTASSIRILFGTLRPLGLYWRYLNARWTQAIIGFSLRCESSMECARVASGLGEANGEYGLQRTRSRH
jgi:hypothetical protein